MLPALSAAGFALPPLLVDFALKSTLVLGMATLIAAGLRRSSAAARHAVWGVALGGLLLLAAVRTLAPGWSVSVLPARIAADVAEPGPARAGDDPVGTSAPLPTPVVADDAAARLPAVSAWSNDAPAARGRWSGASMVLAAWLGVALLLLARLGVAHLRVMRLARRGTPATDPRLAALLPARAAALGITRPVRLMQAAGISVPLTWGVRRPVVLLPADTLEWSDARLGAVLTHELAHVARRGARSGSAWGSARWRWPGSTRWPGWRRRASGPSASALATTGCSARRAPTDYADDLLAFALRDAAPGAPLGASLAMARRGELEQRLMAILDGATRAAPCGVGHAWRSEWRWARWRSARSSVRWRAPRPARTRATSPEPVTSYRTDSGSSSTTGMATRGSPPGPGWRSPPRPAHPRAAAAPCSSATGAPRRARSAASAAWRSTWSATPACPTRGMGSRQRPARACCSSSGAAEWIANTRWNAAAGATSASPTPNGAPR